MSSVLLRYPSNVDALLDQLLEKMRDDAEFRALRLSRSALLRMAVFDGLDRLFQRYGISAESSSR